MPRFFLPDEAFGVDSVRVTGEDAHHIARALRMAAGEHITVCDRRGTEYECELTAFHEDKEVEARILSSCRSDREPPYYAVVCQGMPKGDKLETVTQKAVELGAGEILPFLSERCVSRPDEKSAKKKAERLCRIVEEAAKQCGRATLPTVGTLCSFKSMLDRVSDADLRLFCYEGEGTVPLSRVLEQYRTEKGIPRKVAIIIGSEGGFSPEEAEKAAASGCMPIGLGRRILRTETASGCVLSCLMYAFDWDRDGK